MAKGQRGPEGEMAVFENLVEVRRCEDFWAEVRGEAEEMFEGATGEPGAVDCGGALAELVDEEEAT